MKDPESEAAGIAATAELQRCAEDALTRALRRLPKSAGLPKSAAVGLREGFIARYFEAHNDLCDAGIDPAILLAALRRAEVR